MNKSAVWTILGLCLVIFSCLHLTAAAEEFAGLIDYQSWAVNVGYPQGLLVPQGFDGINQDYFHSLPGTSGCHSGKIVIGDSRCCQLGIVQSYTGRSDYAVFAVWGGHYIPGTGTSIMTWQLLSDFEQCFQEQIRTRGECTVYFFATVNDFDYAGNYNSGYISAAVSAAETIASLSYVYEGSEYHPRVIVIGLEGGTTSGDIVGISPQVFNRYVDSYNRELRSALGSSPLLRDTADLFTPVSQITGGNTTFIADGLHYSEATLQKIAAFIAEQ